MQLIYFQLAKVRHVPVNTVLLPLPKNCCCRQDDPLIGSAIWDTIPTSYFCQFAPGSP